MSDKLRNKLCTMGKKIERPKRKGKRVKGGKIIRKREAKKRERNEIRSKKKESTIERNDGEKRKK